MKVMINKFSRMAITLLLVLLAAVALVRVWSFYTESPWTRDARFSADVVAIAPDVSGLLADVKVQDNQPVKQGDVLFVVDQPRYQQALEEAQADVDYYQALVDEKKTRVGAPFTPRRAGDVARGNRTIRQCVADHTAPTGEGTG
ncbi:hypothetical protein OS21_03040 [Dickeya oryzae]